MADGAAIPSVNLRGCDKAMPLIGMGTGTYPPVDTEIKAAVLEAIKVGYRHFDTAFIYGSENPIGEAIKEALRLGIVEPRDQLFITTKLWMSFAAPSQVVLACKMSLQNLQLEYVDLYLIHWPVRLTEMIRQTPVPATIIRPLDVKGVWGAMEECKNLGLTKIIGVSNFSCEKLDEVLSTAKIPPAVNQVALRWMYEQGVSIAAKSFNKEGTKQNLEIFDWALTADDLVKSANFLNKKGQD